MPDPLYIAKSEADRNSDLFKRTVAKANELGVDLVHVKPEDTILTRAQARDRDAYMKAQDGGSHRPDGQGRGQSD